MKGSLCRLAETSFLWRDTAMRIRERFNPRAPCGARPSQQNEPRMSDLFQPTRPLRGATADDDDVGTRGRDFNPRAPCGARLCQARWSTAPKAFQPTRPLRGATSISPTTIRGLAVFQPTRPLRGATITSEPKESQESHFNPRAPCGARRVCSLFAVMLLVFQPTRPLRGATQAEQKRKLAD